MNIEVGEYIRTRQGTIQKIKSIHKDMIWYCDIDWILEQDIIKHSKNIIDLIEVGDYVNGTRIDKKFAIKINPVTNQKYLEYNYGFENILNDFEINSIVTKEQFKEMEYRINE